MSTDIDRLTKDYIEAFQEYANDPYVEISTWPGKDELTHLQVIFLGEPNSPYEGGRFILELRLKGYPFSQPFAKFHTMLWHPNISPTIPGADYTNICNSMTDKRLKGTPEGWNPGKSLVQLIQAVRSLLNFTCVIPEHDVGMNHEAMKQWRRDKGLFKRKAQEWVRKYAK